LVYEVLRFIDSLLRCGVATLYGLDAWRRLTRLLDARYRIAESYAEFWSDRGLPASIAELIPWLLVVLGFVGALLLLWPKRAAIGALLVLAAAAIELTSFWGHPWEPRLKLAFLLGAALVAVSQALLKRSAGALRSTPASYRRAERGGPSTNKASF
jgi:hypothetical protein